MDKLRKIRVKCIFWGCIVIFIVGLVLFEAGNIRDVTIRVVTRMLPLENRVHDNYLLKQYINDTTSLSNTIILIGDSHLYYFHQYAQCNKHIVNRAIPGETTKGIMVRDTLDLRNVYGSKIIFQVGYNDLKYRNVSQIFRYLDSLIQCYKRNCLIVLSLFPVNKERTWINKQICQINLHLQEQCRRSNITFINVYDELLNEEGTGINPDYSIDGVHLNESGYHILKNHLL